MKLKKEVLYYLDAYYTKITRLFFKPRGVDNNCFDQHINSLDKAIIKLEEVMTYRGFDNGLSDIERRSALSFNLKCVCDGLPVNQDDKENFFFKIDRKKLDYEQRITLTKKLKELGSLIDRFNNDYKLNFCSRDDGFLVYCGSSFCYEYGDLSEIVSFLYKVDLNLLKEVPVFHDLDEVDQLILNGVRNRIIKNKEAVNV